MSELEDDEWRTEGNEDRTPVRNALHDAIHDVGISHDCLGGWIDDHDWERLADALVARGWTPPEASR